MLEIGNEWNRMTYQPAAVDKTEDSMSGVSLHGVFNISRGPTEPIVSVGDLTADYAQPTWHSPLSKYLLYPKHWKISTKMS